MLSRPQLGQIIDVKNLNESGILNFFSAIF